MWETRWVLDKDKNVRFFIENATYVAKMIVFQLLNYNNLFLNVFCFWLLINRAGGTRQATLTTTDPPSLPSTYLIPTIQPTDPLPVSKYHPSNSIPILATNSSILPKEDAPPNPPPIHLIMVVEDNFNLHKTVLSSLY